MQLEESDFFLIYQFMLLRVQTAKAIMLQQRC